MSQKESMKEKLLQIYDGINNEISGTKSIQKVSFLCFNDKLMSIRVPSIAINERAQAISLDWRLLCQKFYFEELKLRRAEKPWLRYLSRDLASGVVRVDALGEKEFPGIGSWAALENVDDSWLFWDQSQSRSPCRRPFLRPALAASSPPACSDLASSISTQASTPTS